jgi:CzcA family heavy metal efflux pump
MGSASSSGPQAALIRVSIRFRGVVIALACVVLGYGVYSLRQARYDVFPEFAPPQAVIQTEAPGLAPTQVDVLVTQPIENNLNGVPGLRALRSTSIQGLSLIVATFEPSTDVYRDRQIVAERLSAIESQLPAGVEAPVMTPLTSSASLVLVAGLTSEQRSLMELRTIAEWTMRPRLLAVPGVSKVAIFGGESRSLQIQIRPDDLTRFDIGLNDVLRAAERATGVRGAGFIENANQRIVLQTEGQSTTPADLARTVVLSRGGASVTLANVATIVDAPLPAIGAAAIDGDTGVVLNISAQYGANTVEVTRRLEVALDELRPGLQRAGIALHDNLFRPADFVETATNNVWLSLLLGGVLVIVVLFIFLFDVRTAAVSCIAIPLSLLAAIVVLQRFGVALNTMVLGGLAISIGVVVDDAVVDVENIVRRLRENARHASPRPAAAVVVLDACLEVRSAVVYATFAVLLVVVPILTLSGVAGRLFAPLGMAYALAVLASLLVTLTVTPALAAAFLVRGHVRSADPPMIRWLRAGYVRLLARVAPHPGAAVAGVALLTALGCTMLTTFGGSFIPALNEQHFTLHMTAIPGTSVAESLRLGGLVTKALRQLPAVRSVAQRVGRGELADDTDGPHVSEFEVDLLPLSGDEAEAAQAAMRQALARIPGASFTIVTFLSERMDEVLSGYTAPVVVNILGHDLDVLDQKAQQVADILRRIGGAVDVTIQSPPGMPQLMIRLRREDVERWGFDPVDVLDAVRTAYGGQTVGETYEGNRVFPVVAILDPTQRSSIAQVTRLPLRSPAGIYVHLGQLADIYESAGPYQVLHQGAQRVQTVTANLAGRDIVSLVDEARAQVAAKVALPPGTYIQFAGEAQARERSQRDLLVNTLICSVGIVILLAVITHHAGNLVLVLAGLPFAFVGGVFAVFVSGGLLSLGSMVGFVALFGITLRNSILMIAHYEHLVGTERRPWTIETAIEGAADRLAPIAMTSLVTALGVLPLAIGMNEPGREIEGPMAVVILGGLLTSMVLNLLILPTLALRYGRFDPSERDELADRPQTA